MVVEEVECRLAKGTREPKMFCCVPLALRPAKRVRSGEIVTPLLSITCIPLLSVDDKRRRGVQEIITPGKIWLAHPKIVLTI